MCLRTMANNKQQTHIHTGTKPLHFFGGAPHTRHFLLKNPRAEYVCGRSAEVDAMRYNFISMVRKLDGGQGHIILGESRWGASHARHHPTTTTRTHIHNDMVQYTNTYTHDTHTHAHTHTCHTHTHTHTHTHVTHKHARIYIKHKHTYR